MYNFDPEALQIDIYLKESFSNKNLLTRLSFGQKTRRYNAQIIIWHQDIILQNGYNRYF